MSIERALLSVFDKSGVVELARGLRELGVEIISTGGTQKALEQAGLKVTSVSSITGFPEILEGRVKTMHPRIHAGLLALRGNPEHARQLAEQKIKPIDMVVVNLYPFEATVAKGGSLRDALESIDIGGPALVRAAAKNYESVAVLTSPSQYGAVLEEMRRRGELSVETRRTLALEAFAYTARYDIAIASYLQREFGLDSFPHHLLLSYERVKELRYGENPHQRGVLYAEPVVRETCVIAARLLQGKEMSYNNILDADSALALLKEFDEPAVVIIKHNNPCGVAIGKSLFEAYKKAKDTDPEAAFGGVVALNKEVDGATAKAITSILTDVVLAPSYSNEALAAFKLKPNMRVLELGEIKREMGNPLELRSVVGGLLLQERNAALLIGETKVVTKRRPTEQEMRALMFAWKVCKHAKSNAIIYAREDRTIGIGVGQMKRADSSRIGAMKAGANTKGTVMASDAFIPFRDTIDLAAQAGVTAVIQPGGSVKDGDVIRACDEHGMAMLFTGTRHFRH